jgi:hypothetical protein
MEPNGLEILTQDDVRVKRYTIAPGTSTSLASLMGRPRLSFDSWVAWTRGFDV